MAIKYSRTEKQATVNVKGVLFGIGSKTLEERTAAEAADNLIHTKTKGKSRE